MGAAIYLQAGPPLYRYNDNSTHDEVGLDLDGTLAGNLAMCAASLF